MELVAPTVLCFTNCRGGLGISAFIENEGCCRSKKYELIYIKLTWIILCGCFLSFLYKLFISGEYENTTRGLVLDFTLLTVGYLYNYVKFRLVKNETLLHTNVVYVLSRVFEILIITVASYYRFGDEWIIVVLFFPIIMTSLSRGSRLTFFLVAFAFALSLLLWEIGSIPLFETIPYYNVNFSGSRRSLYFAIYVVLTILAVLCGKIHKDTQKTENEHKKLIDELQEKYELIAVAKDEIKSHYEMLKDTNFRLEDTNKRLTGSIAEFYTLQQISQAIGSIFDIKELLKSVNDIILGVMGTNSSTIILHNEKTGKLKVHTTNIVKRKDLDMLRDNVNCSVLLDVLNNAKSILENFVDPSTYVFTKGREVNSLVCVPLNTKSRTFGLVLIEHKYNNAFDENNMRLLGIIGQQVGIAMENAELYQKMHELANTDSLTGIYNRLYFQNRLLKEIKSADDEGYELSLAIFDIDHFKKFNDTFGHLFGDKVLKSIAELVSKCLRSTDILARFGGEEFVILLPRTALREAYEKVEALRSRISQMQVKDDLVSASVTVSFGVSSYKGCARNESELIRTADDALYEAKAAGRNCVKIARVCE